MNFTTIQKSLHCEKDHAIRWEIIDELTEKDYGSPICEVWFRNSWNFITTKGLYIVMNEKRDFIITAYFPSVSRVTKLYSLINKKLTEEFEELVATQYRRARKAEDMRMAA